MPFKKVAFFSILSLALFARPAFAGIDHIEPQNCGSRAGNNSFSKLAGIGFSYYGCEEATATVDTRDTALRTWKYEDDGSWLLNGTIGRGEKVRILVTGEYYRGARRMVLVLIGAEEEAGDTRYAWVERRYLKKL